MVPTKPTRPPRAMNTMRSHSARSSTECVVNTTVAERSASWRRWAISSALVSGSRPDVGSSRKKTCGSVSSSTAMLARLRCPPLRSRPGRRPARSGRRRRSRRRRRRRSRPRWSTTAAAACRVAERACERQVGVDDVVLRHVAEHAAERPRLACTSMPSKRTEPGSSGRCRRSSPAASSCRRRSDRRSRRARRPRS